MPNYGDRYVWSFTDPTQNHELLAKLDHNFNQCAFPASELFPHLGAPGPFRNTTATGNVPAFGPQVNASQQHTGIARHIWIIRPNLILESKFATSRLDADRGNPNTGRDLSDFGAKWPLVQEGARKYLPILILGDGFSTRQGNLSPFNQNNLRFGSTLAWTKGKHNFKFGYRMQRDDVFQHNDQDSTTLNFDGRVIFHRSHGQADRPQCFRLYLRRFYDGPRGYVLHGRHSGLQHSHLVHVLLCQDEWKLTPRLTLTPGLRYEFYQPATEDHNRADAFILGHQSDLYPNAPAAWRSRG